MVVKSVGTIKNPLTIIAIFAGIVEVSSTTVLPFIEKEAQLIYIWFLMVFPAGLVVAFFATLNWNHKVLYAPSDYQSDDAFMRTIPASRVSNNEVIDTGSEPKGFLLK